ncbi:hydrogenase maturation nickel metallochaperone HypA/HybF [Alteromonas sp. CYL-A6]|uniref:hydrogenase maturation nickel metallochaperone HypA/HybF n=1 Tax=Alteromonas nitratireducens TaxID=3390813 RepID=UPI0034BB03E8
MHELSVITALIDAVAHYQHAEHDSDVGAISVEVGQLTCVDKDRLQFCFDMVKEDAGLATAALRLETVPAVARCLVCYSEFTVSRTGEPCPCGSYQYELLSGNELNLTKIEFV